MELPRRWRSGEHICWQTYPWIFGCRKTILLNVKNSWISGGSLERFTQVDCRVTCRFLHIYVRLGSNVWLCLYGFFRVFCVVSAEFLESVGTVSIGHYLITLFRFNSKRASRRFPMLINRTVCVEKLDLRVRDLALGLNIQKNTILLNNR